ncbi:MAG: deoxyribose-phosphate aldolase [Planctomycetota bacterium]|nr:deoxyribose-phosphate aldolase [Planctomycetota bacterium]
MSDSIAQYIDHAVLHPTQTHEDLEAACKLCDRFGVASICVKPSMVARAAELLADSSVKVSTVIGFPHGGTSTAAKAAEAEQACQDGAVELDMVVNIGRALAEDYAFVEEDIRQVVAVAAKHQAIVKVIFETGLLQNDKQKIELCGCSERAGADFLKTSTVFGFVKSADGTLQSTGATRDDIRLMRKHFSRGVKASGGIRSLSDARAFVEMGASRLGTSSTESLVQEEHGNKTSAESNTSY